MFDHLRISFNAVNTVLMCKIDIKYMCTNMLVAQYICRKQPECALIGACALIRTNTVT